MPKAVLGLNLGHDRSACLLVDGRVRVALAEERLSRRKHDIPLNQAGERYNHVPDRAIDYCLAAAGLQPRDVDLVVASTTYVLGADGRRRNLTPGDVLAQSPALDTVPVVVVDHHLSHAASAVAGVGRRDAAVMVVDGGGSIVGFDASGAPADFERTTFYDWHDGRLELVHRQTGGPPAYGNSLGDFYQLFTSYLGFRWGEEGKTMGLAGHQLRGEGWQPLPQFKDAIVVGQDGTHQIAEEFQYTVDGGLHPRLRHWFGPARSEPDRTAADAELAASVQWALEEAVLALARAAHRACAAKQVLCFAGGVALNCVANGRILREGPFAELFVQPAATDDGTALGNALIGWWSLGGRADDYVFDTAFLGRPYRTEEIRTALARAGDAVDVEQPRDPVPEMVDDLVSGAIVALFRGGSEYGPRALGHRSILCDPRRAEMKDHLNTRVKHRELFRPFAPIVTAESAPAYFDLDRPSPYMLLTADVRRPDRIPAVTHADGSARVQTVTAEEEPFLHRLLTAFETTTGVPVLLNTSFNDREPIVESPDDAMRCFLSTGIDVLYLEDLRVTKAGGDAS